MTRLELERRKRDLTQKELGRLVVITASDLSKMETGMLRPYPIHLKRLSEFFQIPEDEIMKEI